MYKYETIKELTLYLIVTSILDLGLHYGRLCSLALTLI